jgi:hypothetical protein
MTRSTGRPTTAAVPEWITPQLTKLVDTPPDGPEWLHEIKFDGYRMHARLDRDAVRLLTRTGLDWTHKYPTLAASVSSLGSEPGLSRRRILRRLPRRHHLLRHDPDRVGYRQRRRHSVFYLPDPVTEPSLYAAVDLRVVMLETLLASRGHTEPS